MNDLLSLCYDCLLLDNTKNGIGGGDDLQKDYRVIQQGQGNGNLFFNPGLRQ